MKHHTQNAFVLVVGLAAWIHSLWSFSVVIGGPAPQTKDIIDALLNPSWWYWFLPGAAAAMAVDVGLINLASQFREGRGKRAKLVTFGVLSLISYIGQALFSLSHGGRYESSAGLSPSSVWMASLVWEVMLWLLPAALPVVLVLWAWSDWSGHAEIVVDSKSTETALTVMPTPPVELQQSPLSFLSEVQVSEAAVKPRRRGAIRVTDVPQEVA